MEDETVTIHARPSSIVRRGDRLVVGLARHAFDSVRAWRSPSPPASSRRCQAAMSSATPIPVTCQQQPRAGSSRSRDPVAETRPDLPDGWRGLALRSQLRASYLGEPRPGPPPAARLRTQSRDGC